MVSIRFIIFIVDLVFGLYLINEGLNFVALPGFISNFESVIFFISGVLLVIASFSYLKTKKKSHSIIP